MAAGSEHRGPGPRLVGWGRRRRPATLAALLYAALALLFVSPALVPGQTLSSTDYSYSQAPWSAVAPAGYSAPSNTELYDPAYQFVPWLQHTRSHLDDGDVLWNPHIAAGRPFLANMQSSIFSPFSWPAYLLPFWWSFALIVALKLFLSCFGAYLLARRLSQSQWGALLAGATFGFGLFVVVHLLYPIGSVYVFIPWLVLAVDELVRRPGPAPALALAALAALSVVAGHPESAFHAMLLVVAYGVFRLAASSEARSRAPRALGWFAGAAVLATALAAVALIPFAELLAHSADFGNREGNSSKLPLRWIAAAVLPEYFGTPTDVSGGTVGLGTAGLFIARALYAGALPLVLAAIALVPLGAVIARRRAGATPELGARVFFAGFGALCLAIAFGVPVVFDLVKAIPLLGQADNPRLIVLYLLCLALLAGFGLDDLLRSEGWLRRRGRAPALAGVLVGVPVVGVLLTGPAPGALVDGAEVALGLIPASTAFDVVHARALFWWGLFGALSLVLLVAWSHGRLSGRALAVATLALTCADLFRAGVGFNPAISQETATLPVTPAIRALQGERPARFVAFGQSLAPDQGMRFGLFDARNYDFPIVARYDRLWRELVFPLPYQPGAPQWVLTLNPLSMRVLGMLGVSSVLVPPDLERYAAQLRVPVGELGLDSPGMRLAYDGPDGRIYRNTRALPRAFVVHAQRVVSGERESLRTVGDPAGPDLARVAVTERALPGLTRAGAGPAPPPSPARIVAYGAQRVVLDVSARRPGLTVLSDVHFPGWKATVDGRSAPIHQVDHMLRGVPVPAGSSRVELRYEPGSFTAGWIVSTAALLVFAAAGALVVRSRRR